MEQEKGTYRPRHAARQPFEQAHTERAHDFRETISNLKAAEDGIRERQLAGLNALALPVSPDYNNSGDSDFFARTKSAVSGSDNC